MDASSRPSKLKAGHPLGSECRCLWLTLGTLCLLAACAQGVVREAGGVSIYSIGAAVDIGIKTIHCTHDEDEIIADAWWFLNRDVRDQYRVDFENCINSATLVELRFSCKPYDTAICIYGDCVDQFQRSPIIDEVMRDRVERFIATAFRKPETNEGEGEVQELYWSCATEA